MREQERTLGQAADPGVMVQHQAQKGRTRSLTANQDESLERRFQIQVSSDTRVAQWTQPEDLSSTPEEPPPARDEAIPPTGPGQANPNGNQ